MSSPCMKRGREMRRQDRIRTLLASKGSEVLAILERDEYYWPVVKLANIPMQEDTIVEFAWSVCASVNRFKMNSELDADGRRLKDAIRAIETASNRLLCALTYLEGQDKTRSILDARFIARLPDDPKTPETSLFRLATKKESWTSVDDCKRRVWALKQFAGEARNVPIKSENRTKTLIKEILAAVDRFGGELPYDKNNHTGALAEVYEFFRS